MVLEDSPELEVWLLNQWAGTLRQRGGELQFQYSERWLAQPQAIALSQSLPLQAEPFTDQHCRPFFAGLLPEGQLRQRIAQQCQISRSNDFGLLAAIGGRLQAGDAFRQEPLVGDIVMLIEQRCALTLRRLTPG
ncbi:MAG: HipA N-terminal domain-containing protein [Cyanobium sp.]|jgi:serine/threonine-protein kinase HipA